VQKAGEKCRLRAWKGTYTFCQKKFIALRALKSKQHLDPASLGYRLHLERIKLGLKQSEIAAQLKVSRRTYGKWERNELRASEKMLEGIAVLFGAAKTDDLANE